MSLETVVNLVAFSSGVLPLFIVVWLLRVMRPKDHGFWVFGFVLVLLSALMAASLNALKKILVSKLVGNPEFFNAQSTLDLWIYTAPVVIAAIGANLITHYLTAPKSSKDV